MPEAVELYRSINAFLIRVFTILAKAGGVRVHLAGAAMLPARGGVGQQHGLTRGDMHAWAAGVYARLQRELPPECFAALAMPFASTAEFPMLMAQQACALVRDAGLSQQAAERVVQHYHKRRLAEPANEERVVPLEQVIRESCGVTQSAARQMRDRGKAALARYKLVADEKVMEHYGASITG